MRERIAGKIAAAEEHVRGVRRPALMATVATTLDVRADFPVLDREWNGHRLAYLDSAATSQKPNVGARDDGPLPARVQRQRAPRRLRAGARGHRAVRGRARAHRRASPAATPRRTIFTRNATEAINLVAYAWGARQPRPGRRGARSRAWSTTRTSCPGSSPAQDTGAKLRYLRRRRRRHACRSTSSTRCSLAGRVKLVGVAHVSNVLGTINPVAEIAARARAAGAVSARRRHPGGAADARGRGRDRRRLLRLDRAQGARPDRRGRAARHAASCSSRCGRSSPAAT